MATSAPILKGMSREEVNAVFAKMYPSVSRMCKGILGDVPAVEDVTQKTFLLAWSNIDRFRGDAALSTWLCTIARNAAYDLLRRRSTQCEHQFGEIFTSEGAFVGCEEDILLDQSLSQFDNVLRKELSEEIWHLVSRSLCRCPKYYATIFFLHFKEDMGPTEIASVLSRNVSTVKVAIHRTLLIVRSDPYVRFLRSPLK